MKTGIVADIERASIHDGPGLRTVVFLKGCPLHCAWCHNPECIRFEPQMMYYPEKCIGCGYCDKGCFSGARVVCGKEMTVSEVVKQVLLDKAYYGEEGGVTFSGGEPLAQREFLNGLIDACKAEGLHCAVETSLIYFDEEIFRKLDLCMADLKIWDETIHEKYTGVSNQKIKEHFILLNKLGIPIIARTPVIPGITQEIDKISEFLRQLENVKKYELLPYHALGTAKQKALICGQGSLVSTYTAEQYGYRRAENFTFEAPTKAYMQELNQYAYIR